MQPDGAATVVLFLNVSRDELLVCGLDQTGKTYHIHRRREARAAPPCQAELLRKYFWSRLGRGNFDLIARCTIAGLFGCIAQMSGNNEKPADTAGIRSASPSKNSGAGEGIRTLDPDLGKVVLYH
jgi:hypothetical protein